MRKGFYQFLYSYALWTLLLFPLRWTWRLNVGRQGFSCKLFGTISCDHCFVSKSGDKHYIGYQTHSQSQVAATPCCVLSRTSPYLCSRPLRNKVLDVQDVHQHKCTSLWYIRAFPTHLQSVDHYWKIMLSMIDKWTKLPIIMEKNDKFHLYSCCHSNVRTFQSFNQSLI